METKKFFLVEESKSALTGSELEVTRKSLFLSLSGEKKHQDPIILSQVGSVIVNIYNYFSEFHQMTGNNVQALTYNIK